MSMPLAYISKRFPARAKHLVHNEPPWGLLQVSKVNVLTEKTD